MKKTLYTILGLHLAVNLLSADLIIEFLSSPGISAVTFQSNYDLTPNNAYCMLFMSYSALLLLALVMDITTIIVIRCRKNIARNISIFALILLAIQELLGCWIGKWALSFIHAYFESFDHGYQLLAVDWGMLIIKAGVLIPLLIYCIIMLNNDAFGDLNEPVNGLAGQADANAN